MGAHLIRSIAALMTTAGLAGLLPAGPAFAQSATNSDPVDSFLVQYAVVMVVILALYVIPSIVAFARKHPNRWLILVINIVFGGTGIGWLGSLVWAMNAVHKSPTGSDGGESGLNIFANDPITVRVEGPPLTTATDADIADRLLRLKSLREDGVINDDEYARLRKPLLDRLV